VNENRAVVDDTDSWQPKYCEANLSQCHTVRHKPDVHWPGSEPGPPMGQAGEYQSWKRLVCRLLIGFVKCMHRSCCWDSRADCG